MRSSIPVAAVLLALVAACADNTAPSAQSRSVTGVTALAGHAPPPPVDTGAAVNTSSGSFTLNTTYFLNPTGNAGFIHFSSNQPGGVSISPDAQIQYHQGVVSGQGTIQAPVDGGLITIDLAKDLTGGAFVPSCEKTCGSIGFRGTFTSNDGGESTPTDGVITIGPPTDQPPTRGD